MKIKLHWQILIALGVSLLAAMLIRLTHIEHTKTVVLVLHACSFLGKIFMNALKMVVIPLMVSSILSGMLSLDKQGGHFGRLAVKSVSFYVFSTFAAIIVGVLVINCIRPGYVDLATAQNIMGQVSSCSTETVVAMAKEYSADEIMQVFLQMIPPNVIAAASDERQLLGLIVFSLLFGFFVNKLPDNLRLFQRNLWDSIHKVMMGITDLILKTAPYGIFGLVMPVMLRTGFSLFKPMLFFFSTVVIALLIFSVGVMGLMLRYVGKVDPWAHFKAMVPALLTAFSTASSASALPIALDSLEQDSKVSNRLTSFILPLGVTINLAGTALYECVVVLFIGQIYGTLTGTYLSWTDQFFVVIMALLTSFGVAAIPAASLVAITIILGAVGLPVEAVGIVWVTDRLLDMFRSAVSVFTNTCGAIIIARSEGEETAYPL